MRESRAIGAYLYHDRKHPYFIIRFEDGSRKSFKTLLNRENAEKLLAEIENRIGLKTFNMADYAAKRRAYITLETAAVEYVHEREKSVELGQLSKLTLENDVRSLILLAKDTGKKAVVGDLDLKRLEGFKIRLMTESVTQYGGHYSLESVRLFLMCLSHFFNWAKEKGYCSENPAGECRRKSRRGESKEMVRYCTRQQVADIRAVLAQHVAWQLDAFNFSLWTAARASEVLAVRESDIIKIEFKGKERIEVKLRGKGQKDRLMLVPAEAEEMILKRLTWLKEEKRCGLMGPLQLKRWQEKYLFWDISHRKGLATAVREARRKCGIEEKITFHSARHSYATGMLMKGVELKTLSVVLGHAGIKTTEIYAKVVNEGMLEALENVKGL